MNHPNACVFLTVGLVMLVSRGVLLSASAISDGRAAWLLVMGAVFCLIATGYGLRVAARRLRVWIEPRVSAWIAQSRVRAEQDRGQVHATGGVRVSA